MAAYLTKRVVLARFIIPLAAAGGIIALLCRIFAGPVLGSLYDTLSAFRQSPPIAREILIIDTGDADNAKASPSAVVPPQVAGRLILTLTEMSASSLVFLMPLLGGFDGEKAGEGELRYYFEEEFKTISGNIKNLFDGIRLGSIEPLEAPRFVNEALRITEQGKEKLLQSAFRSAEESELRLEKSINVFGEVYFPQDAQLSMVNGGNARMTSGIRAGSYSVAATDRDGVLRRIVPYIEGENESEHIAWTALKNTKYGRKNLERFLDATGAIIIEKPRESAGFRFIKLSFFLDYDELERTLQRLLSQEMSLAAYAGISVERYPPFLFEKAALLQEELLNSNDDLVKSRWLDARAACYAALGNFFTNETRSKIEVSFKKLIDDEKRISSLNDAGIAKIIALREAELQKFEIAREVYGELASIRQMLNIALHNAFCVLGNSGEPALVSGLDGTDAEEDPNSKSAASPAVSAPSNVQNNVKSAALLANAILTEAVIKSADMRDVALRSAICAFLLVVIMLKLRFITSIIIGVLASCGIFSGFCYSFVLSSLWIDPLIPSAAAGIAAFVSVLCAFYARNRMAQQIRLRFSSRISPQNLRRLIACEKPLPSNGASVFAAVVAVRNSALTALETSELPSAARTKIERFRSEVKDSLKSAGAVIVDCSGDMVIAVFGSPLERLAMKRAKLPPYRESQLGWEGSTAQKAAALVASLPPAKAKSAPWNFGIDYGECVFSWSPLSGYSAVGRAVARARLLARLCLRYKTKTLISAEASEKIDPSIIKKTEKKTFRKKRRSAASYFELC